ncbi:alpha/beta hydrolase [Streptomyces bobili]|uniref:alpha/beta fold hydrolase n=1 Tax=Streptomyces bobili TaxID=67280 RepID=UPI0022566324|nr:alpha/beta hydrolase [Streptomyces bobili]MCX5528528.1 alpha/beta hydrolase [Streptomyces bobili]
MGATGTYVQLPGVRSWYESEGAGDPLLLLHGGLCTNDTWGAQRAAFAERFRLFLPERRGHGHTPDVDGPLSYRAMADDTIAFIESVVGGPAHLVGWSDGGIVALLVAVARPDLTRKLVVMGANFLPGPQSSAAPEMLDHMRPDAPDMAMFRDLYAAASPDGAGHWPIVAEKVADMIRTQPTISTDELGRITAPTLVVVGDDDLVTLEHTIALYRAVPDAELAVVPGTSHALPMEKPEQVNRLVLDYLAHDPVPTFFPVRRARSTAAGGGRS